MRDCYREDSGTRRRRRFGAIPFGVRFRPDLTPEQWANDARVASGVVFRHGIAALVEQLHKPQGDIERMVADYCGVSLRVVQHWEVAGIEENMRRKAHRAIMRLEPLEEETEDNLT